MLKLKKKGDDGKKLKFILKYNGKFKKMETGDAVDVRDFDVANKDVLATEKHLMAKYPGHFAQEKTVGSDPEVDKALRQELEDANKRIDVLVKENAELSDKVNEGTQLLETASAETQTEKERADSLKTEADNATAKVKDLEDQIEKLTLQISEGNKGKK